MHTLGTVLHSYAKLDIRNKTLFSIAKAHLLRLRGQMENPTTTDQESLSQAQKQLLSLKPVDCAQFLTAFARVEMFDFELFEFLELQLLKDIQEANGQTLVTVLLAHQALC